MKNQISFSQMTAAVLLVASGASWAGRPLVVDDANTNDKGAGHVETWYSRFPGDVRVLNVAPAFAPIDGLELGGLLSKETRSGINQTALQAKWRITPAKAKGCNSAAVLGVSHTSQGGGNGTYLNGILSCNGNSFGNAHVNIGVTQASGDTAKLSWGVALEQDMGRVTPHVEFFGAQGSKPTFQIGARSQLSKTIQLDGTLGRNNDASLFTVGLKFQF